ncbi:hypothetical protein VNI00_007781 [Paramarasmius palmivorus]|uniref:Uncharacterized protein n=1 Tax=Paramarasmius palmivorus TaxID=297713 RepID=A0AAW0CZA9_9AGAR
MGLLASRFLLAFWSSVSDFFNRPGSDGSESQRTAQAYSMEIVVENGGGISLARSESNASLWETDKQRFLCNPEIVRTKSQKRFQDKKKKHTRTDARSTISPPAICVQDWSSVPIKMSQMCSSSRRRNTPPPDALLHPPVHQLSESRTRTPVEEITSNLHAHADIDIQPRSTIQRVIHSPPILPDSNDVKGVSPTQTEASSGCQPGHQFSPFPARSKLDVDSTSGAPNVRILLHSHPAPPVPSPPRSKKPTSICFALPAQPYASNPLSAVSGTLSDVAFAIPGNSTPLPLFTSKTAGNNRNAALWMLDFETTALPSDDGRSDDDPFNPYDEFEAQLASTPRFSVMQYSDIFDFDMYEAFAGSCDNLAAAATQGPGIVSTAESEDVSLYTAESGDGDEEHCSLTGSLNESSQTPSKRCARLFSGSGVLGNRKTSTSPVKRKDVYRNAAYSKSVGTKKTDRANLGQGSPDGGSMRKAVLRSAMRRRSEKIAAAASSGSISTRTVSFKEDVSQDSISSKGSTQEGFNSSVDSAIADRLHDACRDVDEWHWTEEEFLRMLKPTRV